MSIVVGYKGSDRCLAALEEAKRQARLHGAPLHVVRFVGHEGADSPTGVAHEHAAGEAAEAEMSRLRAELEGEGFEASTEVVHGLRADAARAIADVARREQASLLVIGGRRRSRVGKLVLGSVVQDLLMSADSPVLVVKAEEGAGA